MNNQHPRWKSGKFAKAKTKKLWNLAKTASIIYVGGIYFKPALIEMWNASVPETITLWIK